MTLEWLADLPGWAYQYLVKHECMKRLLERDRREGSTIPFPTQTVFRKDDE